MGEAPPQPLWLESLNFADFKWHPGTNEAKCGALIAGKSLDHQPGGSYQCTCGLYAYHSPDNWPLPYGVVSGAVEYWGRGVCHTDGARAQYMRILAISCNKYADDLYDSKSRRIVQGFAELYGVPYVEPDELEAYGRKFASPVSHEFRPYARCPHCKEEVKDLTYKQVDSAHYYEPICPNCEMSFLSQPRV